MTPTTVTRSKSISVSFFLNQIGKKGFYAGLIAPALLMVGAVTVLFVILSQISYPVLLAIYSWCSGETYAEQ